MKWPLSTEAENQESNMGSPLDIDQSSSSDGESVSIRKSKERISFKQPLDAKAFIRGAIYRISGGGESPFTFEGGKPVKFQGTSTVHFDTFLDAYNLAIQNGFEVNMDITDWFQFIEDAEVPCTRKKLLMTFEREEGIDISASCLPVGGGSSCIPSRIDLSSSVAMSSRKYSSVAMPSTRKSVTKQVELNVTDIIPANQLRAAIFRAGGESHEFPFIFEGGRMFGKPPHHFASFLDAYNFATENQFEAETHKVEEWFKFVEEAESDTEEKKLLAVFWKAFV
jgi:hypothetical protein